MSKQFSVNYNVMIINDKLDSNLSEDKLKLINF